MIKLRIKLIFNNLLARLQVISPIVPFTESKLSKLLISVTYLLPEEIAINSLKGAVLHK